MLRKFRARNARFAGGGRKVLCLPLPAALILGLASCSGLNNGITSPSQMQGLPEAGTFVSSSRSGVRKKMSSTDVDWDSFGFDLQRTGYNPYETTVGVNNVGSLQEIWNFKVGSVMVHEPVYASGVQVGGTATNILYAGSSDGATMFAINAQTGALVWKMKVPQRSFICGSSSMFSIAETPAIDRGKNLIYFADGHDRVHAADLATGAEAKGWPITVAKWRPNFMHGGFTYNPTNGLLYAVTGSVCDISPWYGRIVAIDTRKHHVVNTFYTMSGTNKHGTSGGGIWGPGGAAIDPATNEVFIATGNADTQVSPKQLQYAVYAEHVLELSPRLTNVLQNNYPANFPNNGMTDFDFGATPMLFQPPGCPMLLAALNKSGLFELYDRESISGGPIQYIAMSVPSDEGSFVGVPAYDPDTALVYVALPTAEGIYQPGMAAFSMASNCSLNPTPVWTAQFGPAGTMNMAAPRSPISIANGVVYISNYTGDTEFAFNAATGAKLWSLQLPYYGRQGTVIANGMVYVSSSDGTISAWAPRSSAPKLRKAAVKMSPPARVNRLSIPDGRGGVIDLRRSPNALSNFGQPDR